MPDSPTFLKYKISKNLKTLKISKKSLQIFKSLSLFFSTYLPLGYNHRYIKRYFSDVYRILLLSSGRYTSHSTLDHICKLSIWSRNSKLQKQTKTFPTIWNSLEVLDRINISKFCIKFYAFILQKIV